MCGNRHTFSRTETKYFVGATEIPANQLRQIPGYMFAELFPNRRDGFTIKYGTKPVQIPDRDRISVAKQKADHLATLGHWKHRRVERGEMTEAQYAAEMADAEKNWSPSSAFAYLVTNATPPQAIDRVIKWERKEKQTMCGAKCRNARGPNCDCICEGKYHGAGMTNSRTRFAASDLDLKPTQQMADNAARGLELREKHGKGGTAVGVARARDIKNRVNLSPETVKRMHAFFARHEGNQAGGEDDAGYIAWMLWGGDAGKSWAARKAAQIDKNESARRAARKSTMARELIGSKGNKRVYLGGPDGSGKYNVYFVQVASTGVPGETPAEDLIELKQFATEAKARSAAQKMLSSRPGKAAFSNGERNRRMMQVLADADRRIANQVVSNIAAHYGIPTQQVFDEIFDAGAENLMDYVTEPVRSAASVILQKKGMMSRPGAKAAFAANNVDLWNFLSRNDTSIARQNKNDLALLKKYAQKALTLPDFTPPSLAQHGPSLHTMAKDVLADIKAWEEQAYRYRNRAPWNASRPGAKAAFAYTDAKVEGTDIVWANGTRMKILTRSTLDQKPQSVQEVITRNPRHWMGDYKLQGPKGAIYSLDYYTTGNYELTGSGGRFIMRGKLNASRPGAKARFNAASAWLAKYLSKVNEWWRDHTDYPTDLDASSDRGDIEGVLDDIAEHCREAVPREARPSWYAAAVRDMQKIPHARKAHMKNHFGIDRPMNVSQTASGGGTWTTKTERYGSKKATVEFYNKGGMVGSVYQDPDNPRLYKAFSEPDGREIASGSREACKAAVEKLAMSRPGAKGRFDLRAKVEKMKSMVSKLAATLGFKPDEVTGNDQMMHILFENQPKQAERLAAALRTNLARVGVPGSAITADEHHYADDDTTYGGVWIDLNALANASGKMSRPGAKARFAHPSWSAGLLGKETAPQLAAYSWIDNHLGINGHRTQMLLADIAAEVHARNPALSIQQAILKAAQEMVQKGVATYDIHALVENKGWMSRPGAKAKFGRAERELPNGEVHLDFNAAKEWLSALPPEQLRYIMKDARAAAEAMPDGKKFNYYHDLALTAGDILRKRMNASRPGAKAEFGTNKRIVRYAGHEFLAEDEGDRTRISIKVDGAWEHATTVNTANQTATEWIEANARPGDPRRWLPYAFSRPGEAEAFAIGATSDSADPAKDEALTALAAKVGREHTVNLFKRWSEGKASMSRSQEN